MFGAEDSVDTKADEDGCEDAGNDGEGEGLRELGGGHFGCWWLFVVWYL